MKDSVAPVIGFENVSKRYGQTLALDRFNLTVPVGQTVAVLGPNGAGKTTAVSLVLGLRQPTDGTVRVFGMSPHDARSRSHIGAMLQTSGIPAYLTVREALDLFRSYYPAPLATQPTLELVGLKEKARARVSTLSGGQLQRLYFGLAICGDPRLLVLDEPTVGLDVEARRSLHQIVREFSSGGKTILLTTHYLEEADALADRVVVLNNGRAVADGSPAELKSRAGKKFVSFSSSALVEQTLGDKNVERFVQTGNRVQFFAAKPEEALYACFAAQMPMRDLVVRESTLEEAFLMLTARGDASNG